MSTKCVQLPIDFKRGKIESLAKTVNRELQFVEVPTGIFKGVSVVKERKVFPDLDFKKILSPDQSKHNYHRYQDEYLLINLYKSDFVFKSWYVEVYITGMEHEKPIFNSLFSDVRINSLRNAFDVAKTAHALLMKAFKDKNIKLLKWVKMGYLNEDCEH